MSGGLGGMEMDEAEEVHAAVQSPSPQKRSTKGKERAVEGDIDMSVDDEERKGRSTEMKSLCCFLFSRSQWALIYTFSNTKRFEITSQQHLYTPITCFSPASNPISPNFNNEIIFGATASRPYNIRERQRRLTTKARRGQDAAEDAQAVDAS